ncbi:xylulokinase [Larsenimonas rhizosphaerae]|uniref:Xylulose kinase n=1 Tax=Larsenimonas rhizosphaerae TaxID=2944682 RepID=A0AA41ZNU3_9GAMM|nr:xylulokinase [Larsenimonas rhizosphaerae]MCM2129726.1 xylulokinase [Larsenimonas rhizosphaerae]MCX2524385.1 xylulokinase [Larsenimonas rhizosphaerae]
MYIGVDCGTQSTKVVVLDPDRQILVGEGQAPHELISGADGQREQDPQVWIDALEQALATALRRAGIDGRQVRGIGISGQQHGLVALDADGCPVYPAKLWNDTQAFRECAALIEAMGGEAGCLARLGVVPQPGYTAPKLAWLRAHHRAAYDRIATVLLPHDYLNFYLTGERVAECGDASGTAYFDTRTRCWDTKAFHHVAPELDPERVLPRLIASDEPAGMLTPQMAARLGLAAGIPVSSGGGDNMMGAIGTGNLSPGAITMSLGTSGTVYGCADAPVVAEPGLIANFCASHGGWLPLICTMNVTSATRQVQTLLSLDLPGFTSAVAAAPPGAEGVQVLPFFDGERVPMLPEATASFIGLSAHNTTPANLCRAVMEGTTFGLRYGLDLLRAQGITPRDIRLVGGGANSAVWRQMVADVMNVPLVCVAGEAAALGAALQAWWCDLTGRGDTTSLQTLCDQAVQVDESTRTRPDPARSQAYQGHYERYLTTLAAHYPHLSVAPR